MVKCLLGMGTICKMFVRDGTISKMFVRDGHNLVFKFPIFLASLFFY